MVGEGRPPPGSEAVVDAQADILGAVRRRIAQGAVVYRAVLNVAVGTVVKMVVDEDLDIGLPAFQTGRLVLCNWAWVPRSRCRSRRWTYKRIIANIALDVPREGPDMGVIGKKEAGYFGVKGKAGFKDYK
jgi:hypothetical protein